MHPCGVLLSDKTLLDRTAVQESAEGFPLSQLDKDDAEIAGVIKLDVLGVRMQSAMAHALAEIERTENERIDIDAMPRDDPATYAMIQRSETIGCFQIESPGQRELVKKLAPRDVADLIVDISLFRPGPVNSDMIGPFLRTRHGLAEPRYPHEKLETALGETGGVVVFHEQVLRVIDVMTGCGLAEADLVRRHLSKEGGPERTAPWFRAQATARGFDRETVERVWPDGRRVRRLRLLQGARRRVRDPRLPVGVAPAPPPGRLLRRRAHPRPRHVPQAGHPRRRPPVRHPGPPGGRQRLSGRLESRRPVIPNDRRLLSTPTLLASPGPPGRPTPPRPRALPGWRSAGYSRLNATRGPAYAVRPAPGPQAPRQLSPGGTTPRCPRGPARSQKPRPYQACPRGRFRSGVSSGDSLLPPRGQGHQRRRDRPHRLRPALHQPARLLEPRRGLPPGRRTPGPHRRLRHPLRLRPHSHRPTRALGLTQLRPAGNHATQRPGPAPLPGFARVFMALCPRLGPGRPRLRPGRLRLGPGRLRLRLPAPVSRPRLRPPSPPPSPPPPPPRPPHVSWPPCPPWNSLPPARSPLLSRRTFPICRAGTWCRGTVP